jgi:hypothetical protein
MSGPVGTATVWGGAGVLGGAATGVLVLLPFRPDTDERFAELGWLLMMLAVGGALALSAGALLLHRGLTRAGAEHPGGTTLVFLPTAVLLGSVTAGVGALAAPALAHWIADGFARRREGWGPPRTGGLPQRLIVTAVVSLALASWALNRFGYDPGGRVGGTALAWAAASPTVVLPPVLLLRRVLAWRWIGAGIAVAAALLALAAPQFTAQVHPTPERLEQIVRDLPVPEGQSVDEVRTAVLRDSSWDIPVTLLSTGGKAPDPGWAATYDPRGTDAARTWEAVLSDQGWEPTPSAEVSPYWLPEPLRSSLRGHAQYELGLWIRASVVPYGDGAVLVVSTRP